MRSSALFEVPDLIKITGHADDREPNASARAVRFYGRSRPGSFGLTTARRDRLPQRRQLFGPKGYDSDENHCEASSNYDDQHDIIDDTAESSRESHAVTPAGKDIPSPTRTISWRACPAPADFLFSSVCATTCHHMANAVGAEHHDIASHHGITPVSAIIHAVTVHGRDSYPGFPGRAN
jgi:hypothetical protein